MKELRDYNIDVYKLTNAAHNYTFEVDDSFFGLFENSLLTKGSAKVAVRLEKTETFIKMNFHIQGSYELTCDRSLDLFERPVELNEDIIFKFGVEEKEIDDNIFIILKETQRLNVAQFIYEFITVSIPMKKLHPRYGDETADGENETLIYSSGEEPEQTDQAEEEIDPRWLKLKDLKNLNDN